MDEDFGHRHAVQDRLDQVALLTRGPNGFALIRGAKCDRPLLIFLLEPADRLGTRLETHLFTPKVSRVARGGRPCGTWLRVRGCGTGAPSQGVVGFPHGVDSAPGCGTCKTI